MSRKDDVDYVFWELVPFLFIPMILLVLLAYTLQGTDTEGSPTLLEELETGYTIDGEAMVPASKPKNEEEEQ